MDLKNISKKYRPIPFWSWNDELTLAETSRQIDIMDNAGIGGFFMHARGGLKTEYLSEEWFANIKEAVNIAKEGGMYAWAYDENGWPSGFGNGVVNGLGTEYQQKYLRMSDNEPAENKICKRGEYWFYFDLNPFYVDTLDKNVTLEFIKTAYEPYYEKFGDDFEGFFTDEPQISRNGIPWSFVFENEYKNRYGENILENLDALFLPIGNYKSIRVKFWKMVTELFSENFLKPIYEWCSSHGLKLTGHLVLEESLTDQLTTNGACMPHYEYMHIPGMDWLGRNIQDCLTHLQVSSVAAQLGKQFVLSETFALCGHNVSFAEMKGIYEWQMVHGISLLCQHLEGYTIRGIRKRDYPPAVYYQQPWWKAYDKLIEGLSREGMILSEGENNAEILLLHPQTTAWSMFDNNKNQGLTELNNHIMADIKALEEKHIIFHLGDEIIMERHAKVENGKLIIGGQQYTTIINTCCKTLLDNTKKILTEFEKTGGLILSSVDEIEENNIVDNGDITYTKRKLEGKTVHFFVNSSSDRKTAKFDVCGKILDAYTGELYDFGGIHEFEAWGSLMIFEDESAVRNPIENDMTIIKPKGSFKLTEPVENVLTLDRCDYYFDGKLQERNGYVLNIAERANKLERPVKIHQDYHIIINNIPPKLEMVCETPELFKISVNGIETDKIITGTFIDSSFKKIDITRYIRTGENIISFDIDFEQSEEFYLNLKKAMLFESEKNKLVYDIEIEAIYLLGDFCVKTGGKWEQLDNNAVRYSGRFEIDEQKQDINVKNIEQQGYPFFCGSMSMEGELEISGKNPVLELDMNGINAVKVEINGKEKIMLTDNHLPLSEFAASGKQKVKFTLINNLRNLLGPHHQKGGELHWVGPGTFYKESCVWNESAENDWDDDYCFVETTL